MRLSGLIPILATPFTARGDLDLASLRRLTEWQLASGADGVALYGMASEGFALTAFERGQILRTVREVVDEARPRAATRAAAEAGAGSEAGARAGVEARPGTGPRDAAGAGGVPVVAGVGATSTATALEQALAAADGGADALMVLPPYLVKASAGQLIDFYGEIAARTGVDVMVQDAPGATGVSMPESLIVELSKLDGVTSVKVEAPPTAPKVGAVTAKVAGDFAVFGGQNALFCLEEYARGAVGTMPACEFTDLLAPVLRSWADGERTAATAAFTRLLPLVKFGMQQGIAWAVHKEVLVRRGLIDTATIRLPAQNLDPDSRTALTLILEALPELTTP